VANPAGYIYPRHRIIKCKLCKFWEVDIVDEDYSNIDFCNEYWNSEQDSLEKQIKQEGVNTRWIFVTSDIHCRNWFAKHYGFSFEQIKEKRLEHEKDRCS
jgi:hypothetical protein